MNSSPISPPRSPATFATAPAWSLLALVAGALVSVELVPAEQYFLPAALVPATLALGAGLLAGPAVAGLRSPLALFRAEHLLLVGVFYWLLLDVLIGEARIGRVSREALVGSFVAIAVFAVGLWAGSVALAPLQRARPAAAWLPGDLSARFLFLAALASGLIALARMLVACRFSPGCMVEALYQPRFTALWFRVDAFGHFDTLFLYFRYFGFLVLPLTVALVAAEGRLTWRSWLTGTLGLMCLLMMVADGGRKDVGTIAGASLLTWALTRPRVRLRHLAGVLLLVAALVSVMQYMLVARDVGIAAALEQDVAVGQRSIGTVDRNFRALSAIVQVVPDRYPHAGWQGVAYAATRWVPGGLVPWEWQQRTLDLPAILGLDPGPGYTWTCSAIGDLYLIGGLPAVALGGLLFGLLAALAGRLLTDPGGVRRPVLYALFTMTLFLSLRALHELFITGFIVMAFAALLFVRQVLTTTRRTVALAAPGRDGARGS